MSLATELNPLRHLRSSRPARITELLVLGLLILLFIHMTISAVWQLRIDAERAGVMHMTGVIRTALGIAVAEKVARGETSDLVRLDGTNPMELLDPARLPAHYLGSLRGADPNTIPAYSWYFDADRGVLIYRLGHPEEIGTTLPEPPRLEFRLEIRHDGHAVGGAALKVLTPYQWKQEG